MKGTVIVKPGPLLASGKRSLVEESH